MSVFFNRQPTSIEPMPNVTQIGSSPDFGAYGACRDANLVQGSASAATNRTQTFAAGVDDNLHVSQSIAWIGYPMVAGTTGLGAFQTDVWADVSAVPLIGYVNLNAALFKWLANDSAGGQIGTLATSVTSLSTTITKFTLVFGASLNISYNDGDRFYIEYWFTTADSVSLGDSGLYTLRVRYDSATRNTSFTCPGTQDQFVAGAPTRTTLNFGI